MFFPHLWELLVAVDMTVEGRRLWETVHQSTTMQTVEDSKTAVKSHRIFDAR